MIPKRLGAVLGLATAPTGVTQRERGIWEIDLRYNCGSSGVKTVVPWEGLPKVMLGATYGASRCNFSGCSRV